MSVSLEYDEILSIINDVFLSNFYDKKNKDALLVGSDRLNQWTMYFKSKDLGNFPRIGNGFIKTREIHNNFFNDILKNNYNIINEILLIGKGYISLCGGAISDLINDIYPTDFDLFFHSVTIEEADILLSKCMDYVKNLNLAIFYKRSQGVITVIITVNNKKINMQFIQRIYKTKNNILLGFDLAGSRLGWNPVDKFFSTICGAIALSMKSFPVDTTQRSLSHEYRLKKYIRKGFNVLLPGLPDGFKGTVVIPSHILVYLYNSYNILSDNMSDNVQSDYDGNFDFNWVNILNNKNQNVTFISHTFDEINDLTNDFVRNNICSENLFYRFALNNKKDRVVNNFFQDKYEEFTLALNNNIECAKIIFEQRKEYYVQQAKEIALNIKSNPWKLEDPDNKHFGKFSPINEDPRMWYGSNYQPVVVGISMERFQAFMDCRKNVDLINNVPDDIFRLLCKYWFEAEVKDARERLFNLILIQDLKDIVINNNYDF